MGQREDVRSVFYEWEPWCHKKYRRSEGSNDGSGIYFLCLYYSNAISHSVFHKVPRRREALTIIYEFLLVTYPAGQIMGDSVCC